MTEIICPGRCNARYVRAQAAYEQAWQAWSLAEQAHTNWRNTAARSGKDAAGPEPQRTDEPERPTIRPWLGRPIWCGPCATSIMLCLAGLDDLMSLRLRHADGYQATGDPLAEKVRTTKAEASSPSPGQDELDELVGWLNEWEQALRDTQRWGTVPYRGVAAPALTGAIAWLLPRLDTMLAHPDLAADFGRGVFMQHSRLQAATQTRPAMHHKPIPCPKCHHLSLFLHDRDQSVRCNRTDECGVIVSASEYARLEEEAEGQVAS
jgi:hypothetical protein